MSEKAEKSVRFVYKIFLAVLTVAVGISFIAQIISIYTSVPDRPYTPENISKHWKEIEWIFWLWICFIVGGGILSIFLPEEKIRPKAYIQTKDTLVKLQSRLPAETDALTKSYRVFRHVLYAVSLALCTVSVSVSLYILLSSSYQPKFHSEFFTAHGGAAGRLLGIMPWMLAAFITAAVVGVLADRSRKIEIGVLKGELVKNAGQKREKRTIESLRDKLYRKLRLEKWEKWLLLGVRIAVCVVGVVFVIVGICNGGMTDVLKKAIEICTQCIGLG